MEKSKRYLMRANMNKSKENEIASFTEIIQATFNTKIIQIWIPADNIMEKVAYL